MNRNYTVLFLCLFSASISAGMALKSVFSYAMLIGIGCATIFLLCAAYCQGKRQQETEL